MFGSSLTELIFFDIKFNVILLSAIMKNFIWYMEMKACYFLISEIFNQIRFYLIKVYSLTRYVFYSNKFHKRKTKDIFIISLKKSW